MADLLAQVRRYLRRYALLDPNQTLVVGVSGGPDSLCLLHLLHRMAPDMGVRLVVAHLNHGLRGDDAESDARFVADVAAGLGVPCTLRHAHVAELAETAGLSLEEAARHARYIFLAEVAAEVGATVVAVGHNADDQAETVLMHFLRGSGVAGLRGMLPKAPLADYRLLPERAQANRGVAKRESGGAEKEPPVALAPGHLVAGSDLWLIRPLLSIPRAAIERYCADQGLRPRFDRSNEDTTFFRNRLRHELLPILEGYNPRIRSVLAHTAEVLAGDHEVLRADAAEAWERAVVPHPRPLSRSREAVAPAPRREDDQGVGRAGEIQFDLAAWRALSLGLQRAVIREAIHRLRSTLRDINWEHVERAVWLAREGGTGQTATLAAGLELRIGYRSLRIAAEGAAWELDVPQVTGEEPVRAPGVTILGGGWRVEVLRGRREAFAEDLGANVDPWMAILDAGVAGAELWLRPRRPGDRFCPQGLAGHSAKLSEFMINAQVPRDARAGWPLLVGAGGIAWVCGLRVDERAVVRSSTEEVWQVRILRDDS